MAVSAWEQFLARETRGTIADLVCKGSLQLNAIRPSLSVLKNMSRGLPIGNQETIEIVECPNDGAKLRVPAGRNRILVSCPTSKYQFILKTSADTAEPPPKPVPKQAKIGRLHKLKAWLTS